MIDLHSLANILQSAISLVLLSIVLWKLVPSSRLDIFRQEMFVVRDELFDYARAGNIDFSHPAYRLLRRSMNGYIRYAHQLTFFRVCLTMLEWKFSTEKPQAEWFANWNTALETISDGRVKTKLQSLHSRALSLALRRIILGSPVLICAVFATALLMVGKIGFHNVRQLARTAAKAVISRLIDPKLIEEEAARCAA